MDKDIVNLIRNIHSHVDKSGCIDENVISDLGILYSVLQSNLSERLDEANNFEIAHSIMRYYSYLGDELNGVIAFEKALVFTQNDKHKMYKLACSFWLLTSFSEKKSLLGRFFIRTVSQQYGEEYTGKLLAKMKEQKMPFVNR